MKTVKNKKIYFASDNHLGSPNAKESLVRERKFVAWLDEVKKDASAIYLLGDLFDFWFEYNSVIPKGFTRTFGKLAEISDLGINIHFFVGNHDMWMREYFQKELNINVYYSPQKIQIDNKKFFIAHGDGLGPNDKSYKRMKKVFKNPFFQWLFKWVHPDIGVKLGQYLSKKNKLNSAKDDLIFKDNDSEWLTQYCKMKLKENHYDYFIFGHRHLPLEIDLNSKSKYINLGDWITHFTYAVFDNGKIKLLKY